MKVIGLTGQTGAGKGTFSRFLPFPTLDTDAVARSVVEVGKPCLCELVEYFGEKILNDDKTLNRKLLGSIAFSDSEKLAALNAITHKYISEEVRAWLDEMRKNGESAAVIDAPQLFESGEDALCDITVAVLSDEKIRLSRIMARDGISEEYARTRMKAQKSEEFFRENCTVCIENNGSGDELREKAERFVSMVLGGEGNWQLAIRN